MSESGVKELWKVIKSNDRRRKIKRSKSDKVLTLLRRIEVQRKLDAESENVFFELPYNKESQIETVKMTKGGVNKNEIVGECENEENPDVNFFFNVCKTKEEEMEETRLKNLERRKRKAVKLQISDEFGYQFIMKSLARECYLAKTIVEAAIINR